MGSRPAANPRYLKSGQLASFFWVICFLLLPVVFWGAGFGVFLQRRNVECGFNAREVRIAQSAKRQAYKLAAWVRFRQGQEIVLSWIVPRPVLGSGQPHTQWIIRDVSQTTKWPVREMHNSPQSSTKGTPPCVFMEWAQRRLYIYF
jgi:hypothetical protein